VASPGFGVRGHDGAEWGRVWGGVSHFSACFRPQNASRSKKNCKFHFEKVLLTVTSTFKSGGDKSPPSHTKVESCTYDSVVKAESCLNNEYIHVLAVHFETVICTSNTKKPAGDMLASCNAICRQWQAADRRMDMQMHTATLHRHAA